VSAAAGPNNARKVLTGAAIAVTTIAIIVVAILLVRGPGEGAAGVSATTISEAQEMARLRAEALETALTFFERKNQATAAGDIKLLDGIFVPGGAYEKLIQKEIQDRLARGETVDKRSESSKPQVISIDRERSQIQFTNVVTGGGTKDAKTGELKSTYRRGDQLIWRIYLLRIDGAWRVDALDPESVLRQRGEL
jgi:hypothetical protein